MDATLKELTSLVKEVYPEARKKGTHFSFAIVFPDPRGKVYRLVSYNKLTKGACLLLNVEVNLCSLHLKLFSAPFSLQVEGYRQHCIRQEGRG